jgi:hypothetical protein
MGMRTADGNMRARVPNTPGYTNSLIGLRGNRQSILEEASYYPDSIAENPN